MEYDIIIKNGNIFDGTGNPWIKTDIGIVKDKIKRIGLIKDEGKRIIDADGLIASPGFVDIHNHSDFTVLAYPNCESNLMQGITTAVVGHCGLTMAPVNPNNIYLLKKYLSPYLIDNYNYNWNWTSFREFYQKVQERNIALNLAPLVGHGTIRIAVKGFDKSQPSEREMQEMKRLLAESLEDGAFGMSSGLTIPPGGYAKKEELHELGRILKEYGRVYSTHLRNYSDNLIEAIQEAIDMAQKNDIPLEISHLNLGEENWGKADNILKEIVKAREKGIEVGCDRYPYTAGSGTIIGLLPLWVLEGGVEKMLERLINYSTRKKIKEELLKKKKNDNCFFGVLKLKDILIANCHLARKYEGISLEDIISSSKGDKVYDYFFDFLLKIKGESTIIVYTTNEEDLKITLSNEFTSVMTDSWATSPLEGGKPHPRTYGSYPRFFSKYVNEQKILTMAEAIKKVTSQPASIIRLKERGLIKEGFYADIVIFDSAKIKDHATYQAPHQYPSGIYYIIVNGGIAVENGNKISTNYGRVLYAT